MIDADVLARAGEVSRPAPAAAGRCRRSWHYAGVCPAGRFSDRTAAASAAGDSLARWAFPDVWNAVPRFAADRDRGTGPAAAPGPAAAAQPSTLTARWRCTPAASLMRRDHG